MCQNFQKLSLYLWLCKRFPVVRLL
ncbi:MAG: hypothetical protein LBD46_00360 [Endomicrobium sp.]|nr:hypothetical protein [Endomicrobium sp.]